jgi:A/G-specific adenine glycosylase
MLHAAARIVVDELGGSMPTTAGDLGRLPGMGAYTSAAVASIGFGEAVPAIDANAARVLARVLGIRGSTTEARGRRAIGAGARTLIDPTRPGDFNQAVMELGALVCSPGAPACGVCPVAGFCVAGAGPDPASYPGSAPSPARVDLQEVVGVIRKGGRILLERQERGSGWWQGLWILPRSALGPGDAPRAALRRVLRGRLGIRCRLADAAVERTYTVTNHRVSATVLAGAWTGGAGGDPSDVRWSSPQELERIALPAPDRAMIGEILSSRDPVRPRAG